MKNKKISCYECVHRRNISGDAHSSCKASLVIGDVKMIPNQWSVAFPFNYDPVWLLDCKKFTQK